jgi:carbonic anhydrase
MRRLALLALLACLGSAVGSPALDRPALPAHPSGARVLDSLMAGNHRYAHAEASHTHQSERRRRELAKGQHPEAVVLSCADSRVPPEIVFDQGLGDLFVVRVAGNILNEDNLASIEYAVEEFHTPLIMVLGHTKCGAVKATLQGGEAPGHIGALVRAIQPAVAEAKGQPGSLLDNAINANIRRVVRALRSSEPVLAPLVRRGKIQIVGARYDLSSGRVILVR